MNSLEELKQNIFDRIIKYMKILTKKIDKFRRKGKNTENLINNQKFTRK